MSDKDLLAIERRQSETRPEFPSNWRIAADYDPNDHLINLKGKEYLNVQNRMLWFIRDQRNFIVAGLAQVPYVVRTELVEMDREAGYAHYKTYVRDVLGNEATMYGSESARDFGDYAEKASTKSLGRALLALGYGTAFAPEMDEGERVVDSPVDSRRAERQANGVSPQQPSSAPTVTPGPTSAPVPNAASDQPCTEQQMVSIRKLCAALGKPEPESAITLTYGDARQLITQLSAEYQRSRRSEDDPPKRAASPTKPTQGAEMTRPQFIAAVAEFGLTPAQAMDRLQVKSLTGLNLAEALETLRRQLYKGAQEEAPTESAQEAIDGASSKIISADQQRDLARKFATSGFPNVEAQEQWLAVALERSVTIADLTKGKADVTLEELAHILSELDRTSKLAQQGGAA